VGGSHSASSRVWNYRLQTQIANPYGRTLTVCHYPSGASKWKPMPAELSTLVAASSRTTRDS
jgi:hypothetical protein